MGRLPLRFGDRYNNISVGNPRTPYANPGYVGEGYGDRVRVRGLGDQDISERLLAILDIPDIVRHCRR